MSVMSITKDEVSDLITSNNQQMMDSFKALLQDTVGQIKRANEDAADLQMREIKKLKRSEPHKFKLKANEDQYRFNLKLGETLVNAKSAAQNSQLEKVKSELDEGEKLLLERQKHILLADKSESDWFTVEEYKKHDLAEDSDDERRIFSAERRARASLSTLRKKRSSSFAASRRSSLVRPSAPATSSASFQQLLQVIQSLVPVSFTVRRPNMGSCFACGKPGHWLSTCPAMAKQQPPPASKWLKDQDKSGVVNSIFDYNDLVMEAEDDSASDGNLVSFRSEIHPLVLDSLVDSLVSFDFSSRSSVRGRLKLCIPFWRSLGTSQFILNVISQGYKIPFFEIPTPFFKANNASALSNRSFVSKAVNELLHTNLVEEIFCVPDIVNPLSVSTRSSGKQRLILDLRHMNSFIFKQKFKCEDLSVAIQIFNQGCHLFKFDLKSGYHHIEIFPAHRKFLTFAWDFGTGSSRYFQFCVLPFGLSSAPFIFTKMFKPLLKSWRSRGIPIAIFLDDGLGGGSDPVSARINSLAVHSDLLKSGLVPNEDKSQWEPIQIITWLGVILNTIDGSIKATDERIATLSRDLENLSTGQNPTRVHVKRVASVAGQIISLSSCVGSVARIMTRFLFSVISSAVSWDCQVLLTQDAISEIDFWRHNVHALNGKVYWGVKSLPAKITFSDASDSACGAFVQLQPGVELVSHQNWSIAETMQSSTWWELKAVCFALEAFASRLSGSKVVWYSDNQNVTSILLNGSRKADLQLLALRAFHICLQCRISLDPKWIPRDLNSRADLISRLIDFDDYELNYAIFQGLDELWGPHTVDRFACNYNAKPPRFNSRFFQPGSEAVDAFCQDWRFDNNWLCPPVCLIARVIQHLELCQARGTLIAPLWKSSFFWNSCSKDGVHWSSFVTDWMYLPKFQELFIKGKARNSLFGSRSLDFDVVALRIDFSRPRPPSSLRGYCTLPPGKCSSCS